MWWARTNSLSISLQASSELVTDRVKINSASLPEKRNLIMLGLSKLLVLVTISKNYITLELLTAWFHEFPILNTVALIGEKFKKKTISWSWHQTTEQPTMFSLIFSTKFSQFEQLKKKSLVQNWDKTCFGPIKSLFSFSSAKTEKNS